MTSQPFRTKIGILICVALCLFVFYAHFKNQSEADRLEAQLGRLESRLNSFESQEPLQRGRQPQPAFEQGELGSNRVIEGDRDDQRDSGDQATAELKQQVSELRQALAERQIIPPDQASIDAAKERIFDQVSSAGDKMRALRLLRSADARSDDVVLAMIEVYNDESDPRIRADVFRQLEGVNTPELREPLLKAVSEEEIPDVREEAAETLAHFLPDDNVREWLEYLRDNDPDDDVREQATRSLGRDQQ